MILLSIEHLSGAQYENTPVEKAREGFLRELTERGLSSGTETVPVTAAAGRVTAAPVYAAESSPRYNTCAMDGIALSSSITIGASKTSPVMLTREQYVQVSTGSPLPEGCDAVIMSEDVAQGNDGGVAVLAQAAPWQHIRQVGEDICAGEMILPSFTEITPAALGAVLSCGVNSIEVIKKPVVGIISVSEEQETASGKRRDNHERADESEMHSVHGDEIYVARGDEVYVARGDGHTPDRNTAIYTAMIKQWGAVTVAYISEKCRAADLRAVISGAAAACDAVVVCAESLTGTADITAQALGEAGEILFRGVAIMPGKPVILSICGGKPVIGVPGNPVSGIIILEEFLKPVIEILSGAEPEQREYADAALTRQVLSNPDYKEYVRVGLGYVTGKLIAIPLSRGSGVVSSFMKADGIVEIPLESGGYKNGEMVPVRLLKPFRSIETALVAIGSHDPLLDELSELMKRHDRRYSMKSSHVGSMGGLMAIKRGEAHIAGTHLLDESSGEYNIQFIKKQFPKGGVRLVQCVRREQGLMLNKGNPDNIESMSDIARDDIRYVNRQKGSGTRILCDYLCRRFGVDTSKVRGYDREEYTHTSVAAIIASGSADAGLGILSAAGMYGLDFLHICDEQYDLLIPDYAWDLPVVKYLLEILKSDAFAQRLQQLGGYKIDKPGDVLLRL